MQTLSTRIEFVLGCQMKPSTKVSIIALLLADKPLTVVELNNYFRSHKTLDNYKTLFEDELQTGLVQLCRQKDSNGCQRQHFLIDVSTLDKLISEL